MIRFTFLNRRNDTLFENDVTSPSKTGFSISSRDKDVIETMIEHHSMVSIKGKSHKGCVNGIQPVESTCIDFDASCHEEVLVNSPGGPNCRSTQEYREFLLSCRASASLAETREDPWLHGTFCSSALRVCCGGA